MEEFKKLGLSDNAIQVLKKKGFTSPTAIQKKVIPLLLEGKKDIVGQSQTGSGKTAGFALPLLEKIKTHSKIIQAVVLTPTRELAIQVAQEIDSLKWNNEIKVLSVYGGASIEHQIQHLKQGVDIVVGTPGRMMDLQRRRCLVLNNVNYVVLDEADEMLNMGFVDDIETILKNTPKNRTMLLFSATIPKPIIKIAEKYMRNYVLIEIEKTQIITRDIEQIYYDINRNDKIEGLRRIIDYYIDFHGIVFCNTKMEVDSMTQQLTQMGYHVAALHGDIAQNQREKILKQFRERYVNVLVATDVAARGIDVNDLTHVINYSLPQSPQVYVHRIGRTGRAGKKGIAVTFVIPSEKGKLKFIERAHNCKIIKKELPSAEDIIKNKEAQIKTIIETALDTNEGESSKYRQMAKELLKEHNPEEVISAVLKYGFKHELDSSTYKNISEPKYEKASSRSDERSRRKSRQDRGRSHNKKWRKNRF